MGVKFQTLSGYEHSSKDLPKEIVKTAAEFYGVSETEVMAEPVRVQEDATPYRLTTVPVELMTDQQLDELDRSLSDRVTQNRGIERAKIIEALNTIGYEKDRRAAVPKVSSGYTLNEAAALKTHYGKPGAPAASGSPESESPPGEHHSSESGKGAPTLSGQDAPPLTRAAKRSQK